MDQGYSRGIKGKGTMELSGGVLHLRWKPGARVDAQDVRAWLTAMHIVGHGVPLPVLINMQEVTYSPAARKIFPTAAHVSRMALLGSSPVDRVVAMFRVPLLPADFPMRYFTSADKDKDKAMAWLLSSAEEVEELGGMR